MNTIEKINLILKQANISKVNLAKYLGVSRQMVYNYLDGDDLSKLPNEKCQLLLKLLDVKSEKENLDLYVFAATDILNANSKIIAIGNKADTVEKAFGVNLENNTAMLNNVVSRKKQIIPALMENE